ncbi:MAG: Structural maintenance of chromosomes protein 6 [Icmadophila ericetorum]|nr:Structural maintenance of chromosomes protein 6 [Icmadophila ericetorum]
MAQPKRRRPSGDDDEVESSADGSRQSSLKSPSDEGSARKRARLSEEQHVDEDSDALSDEDIDDVQATQFQQNEQRKARRPNQAAENGIIESVTCTNFMCHTFLEVTLGPLINFIVGHNGSGKSAVLTAIMLCLGGKATATNRAGSLKGFIKQGQDVKLKNAGDTGYQQEVYGDSIIVERHFSKAGSSGFKIKNSAGRLISTRKLDLEDICDYFALQLDNPISVLTQDMARQFLSNSSIQDKYKFFVKGTQLEQLNQDYQLLEENIDNIEATFPDKRKDVEILKENEARARELYIMSEKHDATRNKIRNLSRQMAWAQVEQQEAHLRSFDNDIQKKEEEVRTMEQSEGEKSAAYDQADGLVTEALVILQEVQKELEPIDLERDKVNEKHQKLKTEAKEVQTEHRLIRERLHQTNERTKKTDKDIVEEHRRLEEVNGGSHTRRLTEIDERKQDVTAIKTRLEDHDGKLQNLEDTRDRAAKELEKVEGPLRQKKEVMQQSEEKLASLIRDRGRQQRGYPLGMDRLVNAIRRENGFIEKPIGPIGDHVRLLKPMWSGILEKSFGTTLNGFVVTSKQDQNRLTEIMRQIDCRFPVLIGNHNRFDYSHNEPDQRFLTSLRALEIENELITRQLIINLGIEQTILIEDMSEATELMDSARLDKVKQCFSFNKNANEPGMGVRIAYAWGGNLSSTYVDPYKGAPRMKTDVEIQISLQRETLERVKRELNELEKERRRCQNALEACKQAVAKHHKQTKDIRLSLQRAESLVEALQDRLEEDAVEEGRLAALKSMLAENESEKTVLESSFEEAVILREQLSQQMKDHEKQLEQIGNRRVEVEVKVKKAEDRHKKLVTSREAALRNKNSAIQVLIDAKEDKAKLEEQRQEKQLVVDDFTGQAGLVSPRVPIDPGETAASLDMKLDKLKNDLNKYEKRIGGDKQQIAEKAAEAVSLSRKAVARFEEEEILCQLLKSTLDSRRRRWRLFQKKITARARLQFTWLLSERGFRGKLILDNKRHLLDLDVQPDETKLGGGRKAQTLSGGEKSFSTICLLLALWEAIGAPIRCLDEFDVFMDSINRRISMNMMIEAAKRSVGRQFILITPQSMENLPRDVDVKINKWAMKSSMLFVANRYQA